ncbi:MAG: RNA polymerase sigma factor [Lachnospiraceae bacterium]
MTIQELEQFIALLGKDIYSFCMQMTQNRELAEDLYQETWLTACRNVRKIETGQNVKSYLLSVSIHLWKNQKRKYAWRNRIAPQQELWEDTTEKVSEEQADGLSEYLKRERSIAVRTAIDKLDDKLRVPVLLFYMEEMTVAQIAQIVHIPQGTVKSRLSTARKYLEKELEEYING